MRVARQNLLVLGGCLMGVAMLGAAEDAAPKKQAPAAQPTPLATAPKLPAGFPPPPNLVRLAKDFDIWLDQEHKQVIVDGKIVLREGLLEMFACPRQTKEHESIVAVNCKAQFVHAGLLALGAEPGQTVKFNPEYKPASGPVVEVWVLWKDESGNHKIRAQEWIQQAKTGMAMEHPFVFAGSGFHVDEVTGEKHYLADAGDLICVSNFTSATLDLPVPSSQGNNDLVFRAFTDRIPPIGTPVRLVLAPKLTVKKKPTDKPVVENTTSPRETKDSSPKKRPGK